MKFSSELNFEDKIIASYCVSYLPDNFYFEIGHLCIASRIVPRIEVGDICRCGHLRVTPRIVPRIEVGEACRCGHLCVT